MRSIHQQWYYNDWRKQNEYKNIVQQIPQYLIQSIMMHLKDNDTDNKNVNYKRYVKKLNPLIQNISTFVV